MTDIGVNLRTYLLTKSAITALVSQRIRPDALTEDETLPAIVYQEGGTEHEETVAAAGGIVHARVYVDCIDDSRADANTLAETVRTQLHGFRGTLGSATVLGCDLLDRVKDYEPPADGSDDGRYVTTLTFRITASETVPTF